MRPRRKTARPHNCLKLTRHKGEQPESPPCGDYHVCCSESAMRSLVAHLLSDDEFHARFFREPRVVLKDSGIELPASMEIDPKTFDRRSLKQVAELNGPMLNMTLGGKPMMRPRARPSRSSRGSSLPQRRLAKASS